VLKSANSRVFILESCFSLLPFIRLRVTEALAVEQGRNLLNFIFLICIRQIKS